MSTTRSTRKDPSKVTKERVAFLVEQDIEESGRIARYIRQHSKSRDILLKAAKKTASQEQCMDNTLMNIRGIDSLLRRALDQADSVGRSMENTTQALNQIHQIFD